MRPSNGKAVIAALTVAVVLAGGASCDVSSPDPTATGTSAPASGAPPAGDAGDPDAAKQQLAGLKVRADGAMAGYSREKFPHWSSQGGGCDTRDVVLKRDGKDVKATDTCKITSGTWNSVYDNKTFTDPQDLDIDHMVPLAAGWRSGADKWTDEQRKAFANDMTRPQLIAVSATSNRSKGDQDPSQWKPPNRGYWCVYAQHWITVKAHYGLSVNTAEKAALGDMLATCQ